jgi:hypothetical protein
VIPGAPSGTLPPGVSLSVPELQSRLAENQTRADQLASNLYDSIESIINANIAQRSDLTTRIEGGITSRLASLNERATKVSSKITKSINNKLGQAYTYAFPLGITYPSNDAIVHGLQSKDMVAALGAAPFDMGTGPLPVPVTPPPATVPPPIPPVIPGPTGTTGGGGSISLPPTIAPITVGPTPTGGPTFPTSPVAPSPPTIGPTFPTPTLPPLAPPITGPVPGQGGGTVLPPPAAPPVQIGPTGPQPTAPCPPGMQPGSGTSNYPTPAQTCPPIMSFGWAGLDQYPIIGGTDTNPTVQPWGPGTSGPPGSGVQVVCVDGCHLFPPQAGQIQFQIPGGFLLWIDTVNGAVTSAAAMPGPNYTLMPLVPCDPSAPDPIYPNPNNPPGTPCVPAPPSCEPGDGGGGGGAGGGGQPDPPICGGPPVQPPPPAPAPGGGAVPPAPTSCDSFAAYLQAVQAAQIQVASWVGMAAPPDPDSSWVSQAIQAAITGGDGPILPWLIQRFAAWLQKLMQISSQGLNCDVVGVLPVVVLRGLISFLDKYTGVMPAQVVNNITQLSNYVCQSILPDAGQANAAWLSSTATDDDWLCWTKAAGHQIPEATKVRDGERSKPTVDEARKLYFRTLIDQPTYQKLARQDGVTDKGELLFKELAARPWPAEHEIINWAGEQLWDDDTVDRFNLNDGFDDLYVGQFKLWWEASGRNQDMARKDWQAHWQRPGVGEMIEMARRLRKGKVDDSVVFTQDDLDAALTQHGFNTYWSARIKAISYRVAQRRDVQRLYQYHQIDEDGMKDLLQDQGYADDFADQLVQSWKAQRKQTEGRFNGEPMASALIRDYANGLLARSELETAVSDIVYYDGQDDEILDNADQARTLQERKLSVAGLKAAFQKGLIGIADAQGQLAALGMDADAIQELTGYWVRVVKSKPKQVPAATLCSWRTDGLINAAEQAAALSNLGYVASDVKNIVADCSLKIAQANQKAEAKALAAAQKAAEAAAKSAATAATNAKRRVRVVTVPSTNGTAAN